ncbi:butyrophilin subfamily 3 member A3-like isoform X2 [Channa argus]|uniref:butyrophilin subfamily 3 member A3-like isoform X2 n=1 Tax=Channa argus TaxID=215402 RepID=UPI00351FC0C7
MMLLHTDMKTLISHLGTIRGLVFQLILMHLCRAQSKLIGSSQPIMTTLGEDIILPCQLEPKKDAAGLTLGWMRSDLDPRFVHAWRSGREVVDKKHKSFEGRTSLFIDELKNGNISLKLTKVQISDEGRYRCFIPALDKQSFVQVVIASNAVSLPVVNLAGLDKSTGGVVLRCESEGWYPEPEVLWLDGEGNILSGGRTETVRGPDDLYTVSSRVTVDKRHGNIFTCRVQQNIINQSRETHIHVPDDFFYVQSSILPATVGLAVSLAVCILSLYLLTLFLSKKQNGVKTKKRQWDQTDKGQKKIRSKTRKTEDEVFIEERESEQLMTENTAQIEESEGKKNRHVKFQMSLEEELDTKKNENKDKQAEVQQLQDETQRTQTNLQMLMENNESSNTESVRSQAAPAQSSSFLLEGNQTETTNQLQEETQKRDNAEQEVETLKNQLDKLHECTLQTESMIKGNQDFERHLKLLSAENEAIKTEHTQLKINQQSTDIKWKETNKRLEQTQYELDQTKRHVDELMAEFKRIKEEKLMSETEQIQPQKEQETEQQEDITVEADSCCKYICLRNLSHKDQHLGGWKVKVQINKEKPIMYKFKSSISLEAQGTVKLWVLGCCTSNSPTDLVWKDLKSWKPRDKLQINLDKSK